MAEEFNFLKRDAMNQEEFDNKYGYHAEDAGLLVQGKKLFRKCTRPCTSFTKLFGYLLGFVPIIKLLPKYNWKSDLPRDIIGGLTTGVMHVPQGIAYSALSGVAPVYGLYSSFFPVLFYMFFATSRHNSIGSFAVVSLMTGEANRVIMTKYAAFSTNSTISSTQIAHLRPIMVASTLTFVVGIVQFAAGFLRLEFITAYFSDQLVDGFITGAACIVIAAQVNDVLGVNVPDVTGPAYTFKRFYDVLSQIAQSNVIITTGISYGFRLDQRYGMEIVGDIPAGMPLPQVPVFSILLDCLPHALSITAVIIAVHISMAKMLAKKMNYEIDSRQELYALGLSSMLGGLFPIYPVSTAMGRTMVNVESGSRTQLAALFSCLLLLIVILWLGPLLESLPICVLAVIIIMALRSLFEKVDYLKNLWHGSKIDLLTWLVAFVTTVGLDVMKGLVISIIFALLTIVFRSQWPKSETLAPTRGAEDFENLRRYKALSQYPDIHIFRFDSPLLFPNVENFKAKILKQIKSWSDGDSDTNDSVPFLFSYHHRQSLFFLFVVYNHFFRCLQKLLTDLILRRHRA